MAHTPIEVANLAKSEPPANPVVREREEDAEFDTFPEKEAAPPAAEAAAPVPEEKPKPQHSAYAIRRALKFGATQEDIDSVSPEYLEGWLDSRDAEAERPAPAAAVAPPVEAEDDVDVLAREQQWDPRFTKILKESREDSKKLRDELQKSTEKNKRREALETAQTFDAAFEEMGPEFAEIFGEGSGLDMKADDPLREARVAVIRASNYDPSKDSPSQVKSKIKAAAKRLYGKFAKKTEAVAEDPYATAQAAAKNGHISKEKWKEAGVALPTQKAARPKKGRDAALASAKDWYRAHPNVTDDDSDMDFE